MFERYTTRARRTIFVARYEAAELGAKEIDNEHLLLGLIRESHHLLRYLPGLDYLEMLRNDVLATTPSREINPNADIPLSVAAKRTLLYAAEEADALGHPQVGTEHLFLGLLRESDGQAARICSKYGGELAKARQLLTVSDSSVTPVRRPPIEAHQDPTGCIVFTEANSGERVGIAGIGALDKVPREGEFVVLDDYHGKPHRYRVVEVTYHFHREFPGAAASAHRLSSIVIHVLSIGSKNLSAFPDST
jgi:hypothetical protein